MCAKWQLVPERILSSDISALHELLAFTLYHSAAVASQIGALSEGGAGQIVTATADVNDVSKLHTLVFTNRNGLSCFIPKETADKEMKAKILASPAVSGRVTVGFISSLPVRTRHQNLIWYTE